MIKVLVINTVPYSVGGISTVVKNYFMAMNKEIYHMDFVVNSFIAPQYKELFEGSGSKLYTVRRGSVFKYIFKVRRIIKEGHYDIVHIHGNSRTTTLDLFASWLGGCSHRIVHSHNTSCNHPLLHSLLKVPFDLLCTSRLACSQAAGQWLFDKKGFQVLHNAINMDAYKFNLEKRENLRKQMGYSDTDCVIGHVGYFNSQKNQGLIVDVLKFLNDQVNGQEKKFHVLFVGAGPLMDNVKSKVRSLGLEKEIQFYGESDQVAELMCAMDVFLFPSKWEGLGIAMLEAQLMGLPCVASSQVPTETDIVAGNERVDLDAPVSKWGDAIKCVLEQKKDSDRSKIAVVTDIYDIQKQSKKLELLYENLLR